MAKTTLDNDLIDSLDVLKAELETLENEYDETQQRIKELEKLRDEMETMGHKLTEKRTEWDTAIAELPPKLQSLLSVPRIRQQITPAKKKAAKTATGTEEVSTWLRQKLANGPMEEKTLREHCTTELQKRLRVTTYVDAGVIKQDGELISLA